jgi:MFS family permease
MACGLAHSYGQLLAARSMVGIGEATLMPTAFSMLADSFPFERRGRAYGLFTAASAVGTGAALVMGGALLELMQGVEHVHWPYIGTLVPWQAVFFIVGAPGLIVALLLMTTREPARRQQEGAASENILSGSLFRYVARNKLLFLCVVGAYSTYTAACYATVSWAPMLMVRKFHLPLAQGGFAVGAAALTTGVLGTVLGGYLCDYWTAKRVKGGKFRLPYIWSLIILPIAWGFTLLPTVTGSVICFALFIMLQNAVYASGGAVMQEIVPAHLRGRAIALWYVVTGVFGQATGPTAAALLTDYVFHDQAALPYSMAIIVIPGVLLTLLLSAYGAPLVDAVRHALRHSSVQSGR